MENGENKKRSKRDHGTGGVYYIPSKNRWIAKITINGKSKTKTAKTEKEAKKLLKEMIRLQSEISFDKFTTTSFKDYSLEWLQKYKKNNLAPRSYDGLEYDLTHYVIPYIGSIQLCNITTNDIQHMLNTLTENGRSLSTIKRAYSATKGCLDQAVRNKDIEFNPAISVIMPSKKSNPTLRKTPIVILTQDEVKEYIAVATSSKSKRGRAYRLGWGLVLILATGMRKEEALALRWSDIDSKTNTIHIQQTLVLIKNRDKDATTKTKQIIQECTKSESGDRFIPLSSTAILALNQLKTINGSHKYVMAASNGKPVSIRNFTRTHMNIMESANISRPDGKCGIHSLRHTFCSNLIMSGVNVKVIAEIMGHADISTTLNVYGHLFKEYKSNIVMENDFIADALQQK